MPGNLKQLIEELRAVSELAKEAGLNLSNITAKQVQGAVSPFTNLQQDAQKFLNIFTEIEIRLEKFRIGASQIRLGGAALTPTERQQGIEGLIQRIGSLETIGQRPRIGGGAYLQPTAQESTQLQALIGEIQALVGQLALIPGALQAVGLGGKINPALVQQIQQQGGVTPGILPSVQRVPQQQLMSTLTSVMGTTGTSFGPSLIDVAAKKFPGLSVQQLGDMAKNLQPLISLYDRLGLELQDIDIILGKTVGDFERFNLVVKSTTGITRDVTTYLSKTGQVLSEQEYQKLIQPKVTDVQGTLGKMLPGLDPQQISAMANSMQPVLDVYKQLGTELVAITPNVKLLDNDWTQLSVTMKDSIGTTERVNTYLSRTGQVLDEVAYKAKQAAEAQFTLPQLAQGLGAERAQAALALAQQSGFDVEHLKKVYTQQPTGISFLTFQAEDQAGVMQKLEITVDRFGKVVNRTNRHLLGFGESIVRNTKELIRWSVGIGLVYGSWYRFSELIQTAIDNQAKLADVVIALGDAQRDVNEIFDDAARVANRTGESINAVLETYSLAYRAVGGIEDPLKRTEAANRLLSDATILNKLSTLEAADSIDVLAGALRQLALPGENAADSFQRGTELLDKWVAVTRKANVDLATLATAFSITAESAENSGASIDEINAIIAVLSEKIGGLGGRETGNAVRALIGGVYQQQAADMLARYGIAVEDTTGKMRPFLDISKDIFDLYDQEIIDETELNRIGYVLGGGVRRGQQYVAFLSDFARLQEIVAVQTNAHGQAEEALGVKVNTVQTSITKLGNSMQNLAQTMGTDGGVLDTANLLLTAITGLVDAFDSLVEVMGRIAIPAAMLALGRLFIGGGAQQDYLRARIGMGVESKLLAGAGLFGLQQQRPTVGPLPSAQAYLPYEGAQRFAGAAGRFAGQYALPLLAGAYPAISRAGQGDWTGAGITLAGAAIGTFVSKGSFIGSVVGSSIAEFFLREFEKSKGDISDIFKLEPEPGTREYAPVETKARSEEARLRSEVEQMAEQVSSAFGAQMLATLYNLAGKLPGATVTPTTLIGEYETGELTAPQIQYLQAREELAAMEQGLVKYDADRVQFLRDFIALVERLENITPVEVDIEESDLTQFQGAVAETFNEQIQDLIEAQRELLRGQRIGGEISPKEYQTGLQALGGAGAAVTSLYTALYGFPEQMDEMLEITDENIIEFERLFDIVVNGSDDSRQSILQLSTEIKEIRAKLEEVQGTAQGIDFQGVFYAGKDAADLLDSKLQDLVTTLDSVAQATLQAQAQEIEIPATVDLSGFDLTEIEAILQEAARMDEAYFQALVDEFGIDPELLDAKLAEMTALLIYKGEEQGYAWAQAFLAGAGIISQAAEMLETKGKVTRESPGGIPYQFMDYTLGQLQSIEGRYQALRNQILQAGGESKETKMLVFPKDSAHPIYMEKDWKLVQYLLQQILDVEKKSLDGIYNLPSEAEFYVPYQTLEMARNLGYNEAIDAMGGGGGGGFGMPPAEEPPVTVEPLTTRELIERKPEYQQKLIETGGLDYIVKESIAAPLEELPEKLKGILAPLTEYPTARFDREGFPDEQESSFSRVVNDLDRIIMMLANIFSFGVVPGGPLSPFFGIGGKEDQSGLKSMPKAEGGLIKSLKTDLNIDFSSNVQLVVDGRVLADVVKRYLYHDLINWEGAAGATNTSVTV